MEETKVNQVGDGLVEVEVVVKEATWKEAQDKAFKKLAANVTVPGFRKGKAPENMIKGKIDQVKVMDEAINSLLPVLYRDILKNNDIKPYNQPKVDVTKLSDKELTVKFIITTLPKLTLGDYKGLKIGKGEVTVTDKDVDAAIDALRVKNATIAVKDGAAAKGDTVVMDFVGTVDGVAFEGGTAQNYELELGSGSFIPGFEDQLIGAKAEEHRDVKVKFPEQYTPELAGKDAVFACDVHEVKEKKLPELNDEFIKDLNMPGVENLEALKENKKAELLANKENEAKRDYLAKLYEAIAKDSKIEIPSEMIDGDANRNKQDMVNRMKQSGLTLEQYLGYVGQKEEDFDAKLKEDSRRNITNYFILESVGIAEKIEVTDEDVEFEIAKIASENDTTVEEIKKILETRKQTVQFRNNIRLTRIEDFLYENND